MEIHGYDGTRIYKSWIAAKARCFNKKDKGYKDYGGRGITMCDRWANSFQNFLSDMGEMPVGLTLERIYVNGNYEPNNCKWATKKEQASNRRSNVYLEHKGIKLTLSEWSRRVNINKQTISERIKRGWNTKRVLTTLVKSTQNA